MGFSHAESSAIVDLCKIRIFVMVILNLRQGYFKYVNMIYKSLQQNCL